MPATVVIPARLGSTRFPGKILATETGRPLVQHVVDQVRKCRLVSEIIVATDDQRIVDALRPFETRCMLTNPNHPSGTDRVAEVAAKLGGQRWIVNVQGDEPEIEPETVDRLIHGMEEGNWPMYTAATPIRPPTDFRDPNLVKVVLSKTGRAMYFSRSPIPFQRDAAGPPPAYHLHVGIYGYAGETLVRLAGWKPTPCELAEKLEQLRALENDVPIGVMLLDRATHGIDTPQQYAQFVARHRNQP